jgi:hypothetical protein
LLRLPPQFAEIEQGHSILNELSVIEQLREVTIIYPELDHLRHFKEDKLLERLRQFPHGNLENITLEAWPEIWQAIQCSKERNGWVVKNWPEFFDDE